MWLPRKAPTRIRRSRKQSGGISPCLLKLMRSHDGTMEPDICATKSECFPSVAIVIVNWNGWRDTVECLESVRDISYTDYLTILVDNASRDDSIEQIKTWARKQPGNDYLLIDYTRARASEGGEKGQEQALETAPPSARAVLIRNSENQGPTGGANVGIAYALCREHPADYVFLLDNDAKIDPNCLAELVEIDRKENAGIVGGISLDPVTRQFQFAERTTVLRFFFRPVIRGDLPLPEDERGYWVTANANGPAMLIRCDVLDAIYKSRGYYLSGPIYRMGWEFEFCQYSSQLGYKSIVSRKGKVWHKGERSYRQRLNANRYYYITRNYILLANTFLTLPWRALFHVINLPLTITRAAKVLLSGRSDVARAVLCGLFDGYRGTTGKWKEQKD